MSMTAEEVLAEIGPVQEILDEHDGVVNVIDTTDGNICRWTAVATVAPPPP